jgi:hypothetical protein
MDRFGPTTCKACKGKECYGGGNLKCQQRDCWPSVIAAIVDSYGGGRVVVTHRGRLKHHVRQGEFLFIVPDKIVHEPIAWNDIPMVCHCADTYVADWIALNGFGNEPDKREALHMWRLRRLENPHSQGSVHLPDICYT